jgi:hypothetical protein
MTTPTNVPGSTVGGRIGGRIADLVAQATVSTRAQMSGHTARIAQTVLQDFTNHVSDEIRGAIGPLWTKFADDPNTPDELRPLFTALAQQRGQAWAWIGGLVSSTGISGGLAGVFEAFMAPTVHATNATLTPAILNPQDAARARITGRTGGVNIDRELHSSGFDDNRISVLSALAENNLAPDMIVELLRRNVIIDHDARTALRFNGYRPEDIERILELRHTLLSPADAAAAWARSLLTTEQTNRVGADSGVPANDMEVLRGLAGEPPSNEELLFAWRRGVIDEPAVDRGIIQGPLRNEWIPVVKALQWLPLPISEAANAVNQGHMTLEQGQQVAKENGFKPDVFQVIVDNAGIPPGPQEALDWVNRGLITEAQFREIFLESRIKNKYIDLFLQSRHRFLTLAEIRLLYSRGAMTREQGLTKLQQIGFQPDDAAMILDGASADKTRANRDLTVTQVRELYTDRLITRDDALGMFEALGYDPDESEQILQLADLQGVRRFITTAINRIKAAFVSGKIDESDASGQLDRLGLPAQYKDTAFALWDIERTTVSKTLTTAQIVSAVKKDLLTPDDAMARLVHAGYTSDDAAILLGLGGVVPQG